MPIVCKPHKRLFRSRVAGSRLSVAVKKILDRIGRTARCVIDAACYVPGRIVYNAAGRVVVFVVGRRAVAGRACARIRACVVFWSPVQVLLVLSFRLVVGFL